MVTFALSPLTVLLLPVLAAGALRRRRWAYVATIAYETLALAGYALNLTLGCCRRSSSASPRSPSPVTLCCCSRSSRCSSWPTTPSRTGSRPSEG
ncbi:MAG: hypothetical protein U0531_13960 [Dehalococcoidia bacterium]